MQQILMFGEPEIVMHDVNCCNSLTSLRFEKVNTFKCNLKTVCYFIVLVQKTPVATNVALYL